LPLTDPYFRGFDNQLPDYYRYIEWAREFDAQVQTNSFPTFETVRFIHDHTGNFDTAIDGVNTPELQQADNDYAVGLLVDKVAHSPYRFNTLISTWWAAHTRGFAFVKEDLNDADAYNRVLWQGTLGERPYPNTRSGRDLRHNRQKTPHSSRPRNSRTQPATQNIGSAPTTTRLKRGADREGPTLFYCCTETMQPWQSPKAAERFRSR
jgi:hypothetical protein